MTERVTFWASTQVKWRTGPVRLVQAWTPPNPHPYWVLALHLGRFGVVWHWHPARRRRWPRKVRGEQ